LVNVFTTSVFLVLFALFLNGCGSSSSGGTGGKTVTPVSISTATLPGGQVGIAYSATLNATGGTAPYAWSLTSGALPAGLSLSASTGAINGMPAAAATATPLYIHGEGFQYSGFHKQH
jgi:curli biogenesis system outer membrane secretion channel CsgG